MNPAEILFYLLVTCGFLTFIYLVTRDEPISTQTYSSFISVGKYTGKVRCLVDLEGEYCSKEDMQEQVDELWDKKKILDQKRERAQADYRYQALVDLGVTLSHWDGRYRDIEAACNSLSKKPSVVSALWCIETGNCAIQDLKTAWEIMIYEVCNSPDPDPKLEPSSIDPKLEPAWEVMFYEVERIK